MKCLIYIVITTLIFVLPLGTKAETNTDSKIEELSVQVDSLNHQINYLQMSFEAYVLNTDLKIFIQNVKSEIEDMKMRIYHRNCDRDMYGKYNRLYDAFRDNLEATKGLIEVKQRLCHAMMITGEWSEEENSVLTKSFNITKGLYKQAELLLDMMKDYIDLYRKCI